MMTDWKNIILIGIKSAQILKKIDHESVYNKKFLKTKIKSCDDEDADFRVKETPKVSFDGTFLAVIMIDSTFKKDKNYFLHVLSGRMQTH